MSLQIQLIGNYKGVLLLNIPTPILLYRGAKLQRLGFHKKNILYGLYVRVTVANGFHLPPYLAGLQSGNTGIYISSVPGGVHHHNPKPQNLSPQPRIPQSPHTLPHR